MRRVCQDLTVFASPHAALKNYIINEIAPVHTFFHTRYGVLYNGGKKQYQDHISKGALAHHLLILFDLFMSVVHTFYIVSWGGGSAFAAAVNIHWYDIFFPSLSTFWSVGCNFDTRVYLQDRISPACATVS
jgi:hypothetical protein